MSIKKCSHTKKIVTSVTQFTYYKHYPNKDSHKTNTFVHNTFITLHSNVTFGSKKLHSNWKSNFVFQKSISSQISCCTLKSIKSMKVRVVGRVKSNWVCLETSLSLSISLLNPPPSSLSRVLSPLNNSFN